MYTELHAKVRETEQKIAELRRQGKRSEADALHSELARGVRRNWREEVQASL